MGTCSIVSQRLVWKPVVLLVCLLQPEIILTRLYIKWGSTLESPYSTLKNVLIVQENIFWKVTTKTPDALL
jgi:hypothetical protein